MTDRDKALRDFRAALAAKTRADAAYRKAREKMFDAFGPTDGTEHGGFLIRIEEIPSGTQFNREAFRLREPETYEKYRTLFRPASFRVYQPRKIQ